MKESALPLLRCPDCSGTLGFESRSWQDGELIAGTFACGSCSATFEMNEGVAIFVPSDLSGEVRQVQDSYSDKWSRVPNIYDDTSFGTKHQHQWYLTRYHWYSEEALSRFLQQKQTILDAGCGLGRDIRWYAALHPGSTVVGADLSAAAFRASEKSLSHSNVSVIQADLNKLPFAPETFDFVACDQVLPCVETPQASLKRLWSLVKLGGHLAFYVYKEKCPIREFSDDYLREKITKMTAPDAWEACANITRLGKALSDLAVQFEAPNDIPELKIRAGRYDLQRFIYYNVLKCFWNNNMTFDENNLVNFDWFHPAYTYRHSIEEVQQWIHDLRMKVLVLDTEDPSGISVLVEKSNS